jgi:hypothetical protein
MKHIPLSVNKYSTVFLPCTILALISSLTYANDAQEKIFKRYITTNTSYKEKIKLNNDKIGKLTFSECHGDINYTRLKPNILTEPVFSKTKNKQNKNDTNNYPHPSHGQWIEKSIATACDEQTIINHLVVSGHEQNTPTFFPMINGQTKIDQIYQSRAIDMIATTLRGHESRCHGKLFIKNTGIIGYRNPKTNTISKTDYNNGWFERWIVSACDKSYDINVASLPDPRTTYRFIVRIAK